MKSGVLAFLITLLVSPAMAQQQASPSEQALGNKVLQEIQSGLQCSSSLISAQAELAKALARIKELESKPKEESK
jgi:hypothetical protein